MALDYDNYVSDLANMIVISSGDTNFQNVLPNIIADAENRMYRELDLLATRVTNTSMACSSGVRTITLSTTAGTLLVIEEVNVITPSTATAATGSRNPTTFTSREFINATYPSASVGNGVPQFWSQVADTGLVFGPAPDAAYPLEVIATIRPSPLSSGNSSTILTQMLPDVFMAASMVFAAGYMKNFGVMVDDPKSGMTWEQTYQSRMQSAGLEEVRKKHQSQGWSNKQPSPAATPQRV
jgi:hypothetical protein